MITDTITKQIGEAMKAHDEVRLSTLRMLSSALNYEFIAKQHKLSAEEELVAVRREAKKRKDAIEALRQAQGKLTTSGSDMSDRIKKEQGELKILEEYLPKQMADKELEKLVDRVIADMGLPREASAEWGKVIGAVMAKAKGQADGARVAALVKEKLTNDNG